MQVHDRLPAVGTAVDDKPVTALGYPFFARKLSGHEHHPSDKRFIASGEIIDAGNVSPGHYQDVGRSNGVHVPEGNDFSAFIDSI